MNGNHLDNEIYKINYQNLHRLKNADVFSVFKENYLFKKIQPFMKEHDMLIVTKFFF